MTRRLWVAALLAPLAAVLVVWAGALVAATHVVGGPLPHGVAGHTLFFFLFFGAPAAYVASALLAWPGYGLLARRGWLRPGPVVVGAALAGAVAVSATCAAFIPLGDGAGWVAGTGALAGAAAGAVFWRVGLAGRSAAPEQPG